MIDDLRIADITTYLANSGWRRQPDTWRRASIWRSDDGYEVLVPARDGMGDADLRVREIVRVIAQVERRPEADVILEIASPLVDTQLFRTFPAGLPSGFTTLGGGIRTVTGVRSLLDAAGRVVTEGPHVAFRGIASPHVRSLLGRVQVGAGTPASYALQVRMPLHDDALSGIGSGALRARALATQLHDAVVAANDAAVAAQDADDLSPFDGTVTAGVSANLCGALGELAGREREEPFDVSFAWGRGMPAEVTPVTVRVAEGLGRVLVAGAAHLRRLSVTGEATVIGIIESLHDDAAHGDRWRVRVRGRLTSRSGTEPRRALWVRLSSRAAYDVAIRAHRGRTTVQAEGRLSVRDGRMELITSRSGFAAGDR